MPILKSFIAAERQQGSSLILTIQVCMRSYEISESRANLLPELYIVEILICVCLFVAMSDFR